MKALITEEVNIGVEWVGILSIEEYERYKEYIPNAHYWWWLRSPGATSDRAAYVAYDNELNAFGEMVDNRLLGIRPAIRISNFSLKPGGVVIIGGKKWTALSYNLLLANEIVYPYSFNSDVESNVYKGSELEREVKNYWADLNAIL